jgi:hypothetical protein
MRVRDTAGLALRLFIFQKYGYSISTNVSSVSVKNGTNLQNTQKRKFNEQPQGKPCGISNLHVLF